MPPVSKNKIKPRYENSPYNTKDFYKTKRKDAKYVSLFYQQFEMPAGMITMMVIH